MMRWIVTAMLIAGVLSGCQSTPAPEPAPLVVFLYGDSTRVFYEPYLRDLAGDTMEITSEGWYDGMTAASLLEKFQTDPVYQAAIRSSDVLHLNAGIHDAFRAVSPAAYRADWAAILDLIVAANPDVRIVVATSTVMELPGDANAFILAYNEELWDLARVYPQILINDLYGLQMDTPLVLMADLIHFDEPSRMLMGAAVHASILRAVSAESTRR